MTSRSRIIEISPILVLTLLISAARADELTQPPIWSGITDVASLDAAVDAHITAAQQSLQRMLAVKGARTVKNTLVPFDNANREFDTGGGLAGLVEDLHPDASFRDHATAAQRRLSAAETEMSLDQRVYRALAHTDVSKADAATRYYIKRQMLQFRLAGVNKPQAIRDQLKKLNDELTEASSKFARNIADNHSTVEVSSAAELAGLPQDFIDRHAPGADGKILLSTSYTDEGPVLNFAQSAGLRKRMYETFLNRAYPDNSDVLKNLMRIRFQIAQLLGFTSWADYKAADRMIGSGANIHKFLDELDAAAHPLADRDYAMLLAEAQKADSTATRLDPADIYYFSEQLKRSQYQFDSESIRPYLPYPEVKQGVMNTAARLFHVEFRQQHDVPVWDPSVEAWEVLDRGKLIGRFYLDMHPRPGKYSHAAEHPIRDGVRGQQLPEAVLMCNFPEPTATDAGLMEFQDAVTFFHEFGHLMHHILAGQLRWAGISGISMESDFVEAPSQMLERWMRSPQVLQSFARHYQTGEVLPTELIASMNRADAFGRAMLVSGQLRYAAIALDYHDGPPDGIDLDEVWARDSQRYSPIPVDPKTHSYGSFNHLGATSYSSGYYTYMYDLVIAADFFEQFDAKDMLAGATPMRYRRSVLEPGGSMSANDLVLHFLGRPQSMDAIKRWMGEEFAGAGAP
jgi:thimet oligopeptidase